MQHGKLTAAEAVMHFEANGYKDVLAMLKASDVKEYNRVRKIVNDARLGRVSDTRAGLLLEKYGGGQYVVSVHFSYVAVIEKEQTKTFKNMYRKFERWRLAHPDDPARTEPNMVYFAQGKGYCHVIPGKYVDIELYRRLIASAPDLRELLIAALPALRSMEMSNPDLLELYSGVAIVDRVKAALAFIDGVEPELQPI